uniref:Uncharacterized protein n=1 Tax=Aureoumbra lagunensis TaxID=44058 RepID=A0A7S3NKC4_9STRA|mmetsp:Transcript_1119/g.1624  ORF Transcript_1119/g.1624 Transcript_1119/m.1624 type:complete len:397 (+) Transcript_1119:42-1232(+)
MLNGTAAGSKERGDGVVSRLTELESDAFQLKLRNYYLEKRLNASLAQKEEEEVRIQELLDDEGVRRKRVVIQPEPRDRLKEESLLSSSFFEKKNSHDELSTLLKETRTQLKNVSIEKDEALANLKESQAQIKILKSDKDEALRLLVSAREEIESLKKQLLEANRNAEDIVAFEAEQIADLVQKNKELEVRLGQKETELQKWKETLSSSTATPTRINMTNEKVSSILPSPPDFDQMSETGSLMTRRARDIQSEIAHSFDFLAPTTNTGPNDRFSHCFHLGTQLAKEATRTFSPQHIDDQDSQKRAITLRNLLLQSQALVNSDNSPKNGIDPRLADCLSLALKLATDDPSSPSKQLNFDSNEFHLPTFGTATHLAATTDGETSSYKNNNNHSSLQIKK